MDIVIRTTVFLIIVSATLYGVHLVKDYAKRECEARGGALLTHTRDLTCVPKGTRVIEY
jgi:hypothetical protein